MHRAMLGDFDLAPAREAGLTQRAKLDQARTLDRERTVGASARFEARELLARVDEPLRRSVRFAPDGSGAFRGHLFARDEKVSARGRVTSLIILTPETAMARKWYDDDELDILINRNHENVLDAVEGYIEATPDFCRCRDCRLDLAALTLNRAPARYYVSEYHMKYYGDSDEGPNEKRITRIINEAAAIVARRPHHD